MELLRLTVRNACLSDISHHLSQLDELITTFQRSNEATLHWLIDEMKLRLLFFMAAYLLRLSKKVST